MADPQKPAWGSYADLKRIQRERDQAQQKPAPPAEPLPEAPADRPEPSAASDVPTSPPDPSPATLVAPPEPEAIPVAPALPPAPAVDAELQTGHPESGPPLSGHPENEHPQTGHPIDGHPQDGRPESGHPNIGHPEIAEPGAQNSDTQTPKLRAPGHPRAGTQSPSLRVSESKQTGHPGTRKPGTQSTAPPRPITRVQAMDAEPRESPFWPSRKYKTRLNLRFPGDLAQELERYCQRQGLSKQDAAEIAIRRLIADDRTANRAPTGTQTGHPQTGHQDVWVPEKPHDHDDEDDDRIIIYQQMTGNRVNARDRAAFAEVRHLHTDVIREGIRLSVERAPAPVKSFRYCLGAILEVATRSTPTAVPRRPVPVADTPQRSTDETMLLARAVIRQIRLDTPGISPDDLESALLSWAAEQGVADAAPIVDAALDAESDVQ